MNKDKQPEALRLAECLERDAKMNWPDYDNQVNAAAELRTQHARIAELEAELAAPHPAQQGLDANLLQLDSDLLVEARRALWRLSQDYEDGELRLRAQEHLERIDGCRCVARENIFNSHAVIAAPQAQDVQLPTAPAVAAQVVLPEPCTLLATGGQGQALEVLGWVHKTKRGKIGNHFYTYEPHCDTAVRDDGGEKIAVIAASGAAIAASAKGGV